MEGNYSWIREGYTPQPNTWHAVKDCLPEMPDLSSCSAPVLLYAGVAQLVGWCQKQENESVEQAQWRIGMGFLVKGITHWRWLPDPPNQEVSKNA